jgi:gas vesicle protein
MYKEEMSRTAFAFIAGATVGAGVALLFAPRTGSELRSSVREYTRQVKDEWDQASQRGESALDTLTQRGKEWIQGAMGKQATGGAETSQKTEAVAGAAQPGGKMASHTVSDK